MRYILGIDTAGPHGSVALSENGVADLMERLPPGGHSSGLAPAAGRLLSARGIRLLDLAGIAVSEGPGSFTGLRIGLAWAKGVVLGSDVPLFLISAHEAAAHASRHIATRLATVTLGERGFLMAALWQGGARASLLWGPEIIPEDDVLERVREEAGGNVPVFAPHEALEELIEGLGGVVLPLVPFGPAVAELGDRALAEGHAADPRSASPAYGRAPNARKPAPR